MLTNRMLFFKFMSNFSGLHEEYLEQRVFEVSRFNGKLSC